MQHSEPTAHLKLANERLFITLTSGGAVIPATVDRAPFDLDLAALVLLASADDARAETPDALVAATLIGHPGLDPTRVAAAAHDICERSLLVLAPPGPGRPSDPDPVPPVDRSGAGSSRHAAAEIPPDEPLVLEWSATSFTVAHDAFELLDHDGRVLRRLAPDELHLLAQLTAPGRLDEIIERHRRLGGVLADAEIVALLGEFRALGMIDVVGDTSTIARQIQEARRVWEQAFRLDTAVRAEVSRSESRESTEVPASTDPTLPGRIRVVPLNPWASTPPLALGLVVAYALRYEAGRLRARYNFVPEWYTPANQLERVLGDDPTVLLFSEYLWTSPLNLEMSRQAHASGGPVLTVHGGPDAPKFADEEARYFADNPHIDIVVRGEGEITFAEMLDALEFRDGSFDLSALADVPGLTYRDGGGIVRTPDRERIVDLDVLPSPYLEGLFDAFEPGLAQFVIIETNRGCPYGCTFCDWGSATLSRIRKFDLDRVKGEIEWAARRQSSTISIADANFGIFERDVEIAMCVSEVRERLGYPMVFGTNYAKNTVKHLKPIIDTLAAAGVLSEGKISLQTVDEPTLHAIRRSNIKVERYRDLSVEFAKAQLPLASEFMMGLPGATVGSFMNDVQHCIDQDLPAFIYDTMLLPNSPMNEPAYRKEFGIVARTGEVVRESSSYTRDDFDRMDRLRTMYFLGDRCGALRHVMTYLRKETGEREVDLYERVDLACRDGHDRWPALCSALDVLRVAYVPPACWRDFVDELGVLAVDELGARSDSALETVLRAQHAMLPSSTRTFPYSVDLPHDYPSWLADVRTARRAEPSNWPEAVPDLRTYPAATLTVSDSNKVCQYRLGGPTLSLGGPLYSLELDASISRAAVHTVPVGA